MEPDMILQAAEYSQKRQRHKRRRKLVTCLGAVVVFCTTYALILPAVTMEHDYICGMEEHRHDETCFETTQVEQFAAELTCAPEVHVHSPVCYDAEGHVICGLADQLLHSHDAHCYYSGELICPLSEVTEHLHSESCFEETRELTCQLEEDYHEHSEECFTVELGELICGQEETEDHQHTDECREQTQVPTCTLPDNPEGHRHSDECYTVTSTLICPLEQIALHTHTEECYGEDGRLTCGILSAGEHQHTDECLSVTSAGFTEETVLLCGWEEHVHTDECRPSNEPEVTEPAAESGYICGFTEHMHGETCFDAEGALVCALPEHLHTEACVEQPVSEDVKTLMERIDALPTAEEVGAILAAYEDSGYLEGYEAYFQEMVAQTKTVYDAYQALTPEEQELVTNRDKLLELEWLWGAETLIDEIQFDTPTTVRYASTRDFIDLNLYDYSGKINNNYNSDNKYPGFQWNGGAYMYSNTFNRHVVDYIDFGNSNITDIGYGGSGTGIANGKSKNAVIAGNQGGNINKLDVSDYGVTNRPVGMSTGIEVLSRTLGSDGYPALADNTSLAYLFTNGETVTKQNTESIDGLFQKDATTGAYYYNSRWNHAQYSNNHFTLYDQIITPNFIVYPFGNFLPFNDITSSDKATQVGKITNVSSYIQQLVNDMEGSLSSSPTKTQLTAMLNKYKADINSAGITTSKQAIVDYFTAGGGSGDKPSSNTDLIDTALLNKMYNIDWDEETNFFFGMDMSMNFFQPKGGLTGNDGKQPMEFYFTGDDDVWVYIDDVLFLDLTGIHRHVGGKIDFVNGKVCYYALDTENGGDVSSTPYATYTFEQLLTTAGKSTDGLNETGTFKDYTTHSFKFFYMERGSGSSVCRMNFNFPLLRKNSISVSKELTVDDPSKLPLLGDPDFKFQVLKEGGKDLFIGAGVNYDILDAKGSKIGVGKTDANGVFTLKAGQTAVFSGIEENAGRYFVRELLDASVFEQYGTVSVDGTSQTQNYDVTVGNDTFKGVDSPVKDVSDGSTVFHFNNNVDLNNLGSLSITKTLTEYPQTRNVLQFAFKVTLDGTPLPVGTKYTVGGETRTVTTAGIITLKPAETATISNILAGTRFTVTETQESADGYVPSYSVDGGTATNDPASGVIGVNSTVAVTVNNAEKGASVTIPVTKALLTPDGREHTYRFQLTQVTDSSGNTPTDPAYQQEITIPITDTAVTGDFVIDYPQSDLRDLPQTFYYKITETETESATVYDQSVYVVEVTVSCDADSDELQATVTKVWKDGTETVETGPVTFTNQIMRYELPETGGAGTQWYHMAGLLLIAAAGLFLLYLKKRGKEGFSPP